jgi:hypothetical protein
MLQGSERAGSRHIRRVIAGIAVLSAAVAAQTPPAATSNYDLAAHAYEALLSAYVDADRCRRISPEVVELQRQLARSVRHLGTTSGDRALLFAVSSNSVGDVRRLIAAGAARTADNGTLMHAAARFANAPVRSSRLRRADRREHESPAYAQGNQALKVLA